MASLKWVTPRADGLSMRAEDGFTLLEMLAVMIVMGVLVAVAVGFGAGARTRTSDTAAKSNIDVAVPAIHTYYLDNGTYTGMTLRRLQDTYSRGIQNITVVSARGEAYCVRSSVSGSSTWYKAGPSGVITKTRCR